MFKTLYSLRRISTKFFILATFLFFANSLFSYIASISGNEISRKQFQDYVNVKKFIVNRKSFGDLIKIEKKTKQQILSEYVDHKILLLEAEKQGYTVKNKTVQEEFKKTKKQWLMELYSTLQKDQKDLRIDEAYIKSFYATLPQAKQKPYSELLPQEKQQLIQIANLKKKKDTDDLLKVKLEKKFKVKRYGHEKSIAATVLDQKITKNDIDVVFEDQLRKINLSPDVLKEKDPENYEKAREEVLERLIFEKLVNLDIKKTKFDQNINTKRALTLYQEKIVLNVFVSEVVAAKVPVTDQEMDQAFSYFSRRNPQIQQMLPSEQEKYLRNAIIQQKLPQILSNYLIEKKEEIIIKKNQEELKLIS